MRKSTVFIMVILLSLPLFSKRIRAESEERPTTIFLVRHAEKMNDSTADPSLTPEGIERARTLARMLRDVPLAGIFSTSYMRTRETARPTAENHNLEILSYADNRSLLENIRSRFEGQCILIVGHSNTIPDCVNLILGKDDVPPIGHTQYDSLFVVTLPVDGKASYFRLSYGDATE